MPTLTHDSRFFGLDLSTLGRDLRAAWRDARHWPPLAWLTPETSVRLLLSDGGESIWLVSDSLRPAPAKRAGPTRYTAVEAPEDRVLRRSLLVPALPETEIAEAVALDVAGASPFPPHDTVWGFSLMPAARGQRHVEIALASRKQLERHLKASQSRLNSGDVADTGVEVWAMSDSAPPIVLAGFGEARRDQHAASGRRLGIGLVLVAAFLLLAIAITPTAQLRLRAIEAVNAYTALTQRAAPLVAKREALVKASDRLLTLREVLADRVDPLRVVDVLTRVLPDDTSLLSLQIEGLKVSIAGQTTNSAALMQMLGAAPGLREVRAPTAATRPLGAPRESFNIEFMLEPKSFQLQGAAGVVPAPVAAPNADAHAAPGMARTDADDASASSAATAKAPSAASPTGALPAQPPTSAPPSGREALLIGQPKQ